LLDSWAFGLHFYVFFLEERKGIIKGVFYTFVKNPTASLQTSYLSLKAYHQREAQTLSFLTI
jgi:hypothetical protein